MVGSGPAGLAAAQQLNRAGHAVTVFEKADRIGGLLRYGIPDFKMEKRILDRRLEQMTAEGVVFRANAHVGGNVPVEVLRKEFDAVLLAGGAEQPRDLHVPGRELKGIHFAMEFLPQQNRRTAGERINSKGGILATGKRVVIIGGGDTGADCLGTCHRQNAASVHQFEILPMPPANRAPETPWPLWPLQLRVESSHEEGGIREWAVATTKFTGDDRGNVAQLHAVRVGSAPSFAPIPGTRIHARSRPGAAGDGLHRPGEKRNARSARSGARPARQRRHRRGAHDLDPRHLRRRRHAPRPIPHRLGHRRRPQSRLRRGPVPDGGEQAGVGDNASGVIGEPGSGVQPVAYAAPSRRSSCSTASGSGTDASGFRHNSKHRNAQPVGPICT